jgi:hypothetical protein
MSDAADRRRARRGENPDVRPRIIRTDRVHYPGMSFGDQPEDSPRRPARPLQPVRDAGLNVESPVSRSRKRRAKARRGRRAWLLALLGIAIAALSIWRLESGAGTSTASTRQIPSTQPVTVADAPIEPEPDPTPLFAEYKGLKLHVPVSLGALTEVGFHQASYRYALHLKNLMGTADMTAAKANRGTGRNLSAQESGDDAVLTGSALKMWRGPNDTPDSAVDVGAPPGTPVLAPLSGTVVLVKPYKLYDKYDDVRIHIQPEGRPDLDLVLIHVQNPTVRAGDKVRAGRTQVGEVRKLSDKVTLQLRTYVKDEGNHVHLQLNNARDPEYKGLEGAISASGS